MHVCIHYMDNMVLVGICNQYKYQERLSHIRYLRSYKVCHLHMCTIVRGSQDIPVNHSYYYNKLKGLDTCYRYLCVALRPELLEPTGQPSSSTEDQNPPSSSSEA